MSSSTILSIVTFIYGLAGFLYIFAWVFKKESAGRLATWIAILGFAANTVGIVMRWIESYQLGIGHAPLSNLYESLIFFAWAIAFIYLFVERRYETQIIGAFSMPLAFLAMAYASLSPNISDRIQPLIPALKSNWLIAHVMTCFIGYAAFGIAFGTSWMYLFRQRDTGDKSPLFDRFPGIDALDELTHQLVKFGFLFLTIVIITGAVWANSAWGRYWGWDPKETWSLITWLIYAAMLHVRYFVGWKGWQSMPGKLLGAFIVVLIIGVVFVFFRKLFILPFYFLLLVGLIKIFGAEQRKLFAYLSILGFAAVLFTYFGVNLLPGLHSYQSMGQ
jgi:cytochrome c-type biogenesis protein CcsB